MGRCDVRRKPHQPDHRCAGKGFVENWPVIYPIPRQNLLMDLSAENAAAYLRERGATKAEPRIERWKAGGVSDTVLLVESDGRRFVLKQALGKLRVAEGVALGPAARFPRIGGARKARAVSTTGIAAGGSVRGSRQLPLRHERRSGRIGQLERLAARWRDPPGDGRAGGRAAGPVGQRELARLFWAERGLGTEFGDQTIFYQLRIDPYYRAGCAAASGPGAAAWPRG